MRKKLLVLARIAIYLSAFLVPPVLVGVFGMYAAESDTYEKPARSAASVDAQEAASPPEQDDTKPTAVVLMSNQGSEVTDVLAPYEVLSESGAFNVYAVAPEREAVPLKGGLDVLPQLSLRELDRHLEGANPEVIVVPAMPGVGSPEHRPIEEWLKENSKGDTTMVRRSCRRGSGKQGDASATAGRRS